MKGGDQRGREGKYTRRMTVRVTMTERERERERGRERQGEGEEACCGKGRRKE